MLSSGRVGSTSESLGNGERIRMMFENATALWVSIKYGEGRRLGTGGNFEVLRSR